MFQCEVGKIFMLTVNVQNVRENWCWPGMVKYAVPGGLVVEKAVITSYGEVFRTYVKPQIIRLSNLQKIFSAIFSPPAGFQ